VDNLGLSANNMEELKDFKRRMAEEFKMKDLGDMTHYLGIQVGRERKEKRIYLHQEEYVEKVLERFGMQNCKPSSTPMAAGHELTKPMEFNEGEEEALRQKPYAQLIGCLMYIMTCTRPDIAFPVSLLARFMATGRHHEVHWVAAKRVLRYVKGTKKHGVVLGGVCDPKLSVFVDASWADSQDDRRSTIGFCGVVGDSVVAWKSGRSEAVALSTGEAEYYSMTYGGREAIHVRNLLETLGYNQTGPITMASDSQSAIAMTERAEISSRSKHIDLRHHWIRDQVAASTITLHYVESEDNLADLFTKALPRERHVELTTRLHVVEMGDTSLEPKALQLRAPSWPRGGVEGWPFPGAMEAKNSPGKAPRPAGLVPTVGIRIPPAKREVFSISTLGGVSRSAHAWDGAPMRAFRLGGAPVEVPPPNPEQRGGSPFRGEGGGGAGRPPPGPSALVGASHWPRGALTAPIISRGAQGSFRTPGRRGGTGGPRGTPRRAPQGRWKAPNSPPRGHTGTEIQEGGSRAATSPSAALESGWRAAGRPQTPSSRPGLPRAAEVPRAYLTEYLRD
jgi:hypothetical protein